MKTRVWAALAFAASALGVGACSSSSEETNGPVYDAGPEFGDGGAMDAAGDSTVGPTLDAHEDAMFDATASDAAPLDSAEDTTLDAPADVAADVAADANEDVAVDAPESADAADGGGAASDAAIDAADADAATCASTVALVGGGASSAFATTWSGGAWATPTTLTGGSVAATPSITTYGGGYLAVLNETSTSIVSTLFSAGTWSSVAGVSGATAQGASSIAPLGASVHLVYWGSDGKFYHGTYSSTGWDSASDPVGGSSSQSFGSSAPTLASVGGDLDVTQAGTNAMLYDQLWSGSWQTATPHSGASVMPTGTPRIVGLSGGASDLMIVAARQTDDVLFFDLRNATTHAWAGLSMLYDTNTYSASTVSIAPLANGRAMLVFYGGDTHAYFSVYDATQTPAWTAAAPLLGASNPSLASPASVASGVCGDDAIAVFTLSSGAVEATSYRGGAWHTPVSIAGATGATYASVATSP